MSAALLDLDPGWRWALAIVAGGGVAGLVQTGTAGLRMASTAGTGGFGNPLLSAGETGGAVGLGLLAVILPLIAGLLVVFVIGISLRRLIRRRA